jgi:hypothetical protein
MKTVLFGILVVVLMAAAGGVGYYFGNDNGLKSATNIQREFFTNRAGGTGQGASQGTGVCKAPRSPSRNAMALRPPSLSTTRRNTPRWSTARSLT